MKVAVAYYGMSNTGSVCAALEDVGAEPIVAISPAMLYEASSIVLPGVGSFAAAMQRLGDGGWVEALRDNVINHSKPILGICLGMQLLATKGYEGGECDGLNLIGGSVRKLDTLGCNLRIPHVGWNSVHYVANNTTFADIHQDTDFYFVHSFAFDVDNASHVSATVDYGTPLTAAVQKENIFGTQFHPEKSSKSGRKLIKNFLGYRAC